MWINFVEKLTYRYFENGSAWNIIYMVKYYVYDKVLATCIFAEENYIKFTLLV